MIVLIPSVQKQMGKTVASALKESLGWDMTIGSIRLGLWNRVIIDNICLHDQQDSTLLHASRVAAKINILPLAKGQICIANAQLFGTQIHAYQRTPEEKPNFQFLIDTFSSNDTTPPRTNLKIGSILLRRVSIDWNQHWKPRKEQGLMDPAHLVFRDIAITAHLKALTPDSLNLSVKRLSFVEKSGLSLSSLSFDLIAGQKGSTLSNFSMQLPHSAITLPSVRATWQHFPRKGQDKSWLKNLSVYTEANMHLTPSDLAPLSPILTEVHTPLKMETTLLLSQSCINIPILNLSDHKYLDVVSRCFINNILESPNFSIGLEHFRINAGIKQYLMGLPASTVSKLTPYLSRLDTIDVSGEIYISKQKQSAELDLTNKYGNISIDANASKWNHIDARILSSGILLNRILSSDGNHALGKTAFDIGITGFIKDDKGQPNIKLTANIPLLQWQQRDYQDIALKTSLQGNILEASANVQDKGGIIETSLKWKRGHSHRVEGMLLLSNVLSERIGLGKRYPDTRLSISSAIKIEGSNIDNINGNMNIQDFMMQDIHQDSSSIIGPLSLSLATSIDKQQCRVLSLSSDPINLSAQGKFKFSTLAATIINSLHNKLPEIIPYKHNYSAPDSFNFTLEIQDTTLLRKLALKDISIPQPVHIQGNIHGHDSLKIMGNIPELHLGTELLRNCKIDIQGTPQKTKAIGVLERRHKKGFVTMSLSADAHDNRLRMIASLDNNRKPRIKGELDITATFAHNTDGTRNIRAWIAPSDVVISDTLWRVHPCAITWDGRIADIRGFKVNQSAHRGIDINGRASSRTEDTLRVNLRDINVEYILDLVNFKDVEFQGFATGEAYATNLLSSPNATAHLVVDRFAFNRAPLGTLHANANWGDTPHFLSLNADIADPANKHYSDIKGGFYIGSKERPDGLDLMVNTQNFNLAFINPFTVDILENFQGRGTGYCRIYGPFSAIDLNGDMLVEHAKFGLPMLGTTYRLEKDSVHVRPGDISITSLIYDKNARNKHISDKSYTQTGKSNHKHTAILQGRLTHKHFKDLNYDFRINANKFLGYNFHEFGESPFYATCIMSGNVHVKGMTGLLMVDINASPEKGTIFTYNVATPEALTDVDFITINSMDSTSMQNMERETDLYTSSNTDTQEQVASVATSDIFLNFNLPITPDARIRLLMDRKSGDMIELGGNGRIMAKFHNKGRFNIYGTYRVQDGTYRLNLQDIIRKEFKFQPGGTITFGGDAMKADLNLKALYSVNGVSLDDLATSSLGFSKTRVDCIMNLTGHPEQPVVTFDFDLPNATEDERQMVRSIVGTEEERNMQAIYLLGLGRFYNFEADGAEQSSAAMNSLVSSTLSAQLNNMITTAVGSSNWNVSTYLQTTEDGWRNMDVEGQLSGSLLNNRLLLTGNFGYREKYYTQRNFISDVSIEYLLTRNGMLSVKAYNKANDRYFVQSSLNTQGIGLQYKKDFNRFSDLFHWLRPKKHKQSNENTAESADKP